MLTFGEKLQELRNAKNLTQGQLGDHLGITHAAVSMLENGKNKPTYENIVKIAELFDVSFDYLLGGYVDKGKAGPSPSPNKLFFSDGDKVITYRVMLEWMDSLSEEDKIAVMNLKKLLENTTGIDVRDILKLSVK